MSLSISGVLLESWALFKAHWRFLVPLMLALGLVSIVLNGTIGALEQGGAGIAAAVLNAAAALLGVAIGIALANVFLIITALRAASWKDVVSRFREGSLFVRYLIGSILFGLMVMIGFVFLIVPGVYLALRFQFFGLALVEKGMTIKQAFAESTRRTYGVKWSLLLLFFVLIFINILGLLPLGLGLLVTAPLAKIATVLAYRKLEINPGPQAAPQGAA